MLYTPSLGLPIILLFLGKLCQKDLEYTKCSLYREVRPPSKMGCSEYDIKLH